MSKNSKRQSTQDALNRFYEKQITPVSSEPKRHNKSPEKDVERECLAWMRSRGWTVNVFESKAVWNSKAESWSQSGMKFGTADCLGNTDEGVAVAVEFKAKGKLSSFNKETNYLQRKFIIDRINTNAFACVVDSASGLEFIYTKWLEIRAIDKDQAKQFLMAALPQVSEITRLKRDRLFDE
jgi:hypothetical protein